MRLIGFVCLDLTRILSFRRFRLLDRSNICLGLCPGIAGFPGFVFLLLLRLQCLGNQRGLMVTLLIALESCGLKCVSLIFSLCFVAFSCKNVRDVLLGRWIMIDRRFGRLFYLGFDKNHNGYSCG